MPPGDDEIRPWLEALFGGLPDGVAISRSGRLLYANARMNEYLGAGDRELEGHAFLELYPEAERPAVLAHVQSMAFAHKPQDPAPSNLRRRDGATIRLEVARLLLPVREEPLLIEIARRLHDERPA